jgi:hypothetical protein
MQKLCDQIDNGKFNTNSSDDSHVISLPTSAVPPTESHIGTVSIVKRAIAWLDTLGLCARPTRNTKAVKNYPRGVGAIERVEVNAGDIVI